MAHKIPIDEEQVIKLAAMQCSIQEIADYFSVHYDTIRERFTKVIKEAKSAGKTSVRAMLWGQAKKGNMRAIELLATNYTEIRKDPELQINILPRPTVIRVPSGEDIWLTSDQHVKQLNESKEIIDAEVETNT